VAFYVGLKNSSSYDRLWESRKIWGEITNLSRSLASYLLACVGRKAPRRVESIVQRQILYVNILRAQLRKCAVWEDAVYSRFSKQRGLGNSFEVELARALSQYSRYANDYEGDALRGVSNPAKQIMHYQIESIAQFKRDGLLDGTEASDLIRICTSLLEQQGRAERIKNFPFPRQYASVSEIFVYIFITLLPFALLPEFDRFPQGFSWLIIPVSTLIAWIFTTMEQVGDSSENPFENGINDVPLNAICRQIEIDLCEILGEDFLPVPVSERDGILM
jgi:putative membrane protein